MGEDYSFWVGNATVSAYASTNAVTTSIATIRFDDPPDIAVPAYTPTPSPSTPGAMALALPDD